MQNDKHKIQILQVLRAIATVIVFLSHYFADGYTLYEIHFIGAVGVGIFFVLSGFLLIYTDRSNYKGYMMKRLIRICPLYWLVTLLVFVLGLIAPSYLHTSVPTVSNLLKSLFFIPYYSAHGIFPLLPIGWTLIVEMFVYVLYYMVARSVILAYMLKRKASFNKKGENSTNEIEKATKDSAVCRGVVMAAILLLLIVLNRVVPNSLFLFSYGSNYMIYFVIGIIGALLLKKSEKRFFIKQIHSSKLSILLFVLLFAFFIGFSTIYDDTVCNVVILGLSILAAIVLLWSASFPKIIVMLGDISYSFYLTHYFLVKLFTRVLIRLVWPINTFFAIVFLILCFVVTACISWVSYQLIEKRLAGKLKKIFLKTP